MTTGPAENAGEGVAQAEQSPGSPVAAEELSASATAVEEPPAEEPEPLPAQPPAIEPTEVETAVELLPSIEQAPESIAAGFGSHSGPVPWWPFIAYDLIWLVFALATAWQLSSVPEGSAPYDAASYSLLLYGGIGLTALGFLLPFVVWLLWRPKGAEHSKPVFVPALFRGAVATLLGAAMWWTALGAVDYVRLGGML